MKSSPRDMELRMQAFLDACARRGIKMTHQRMEIYRVVAALDTHPDAAAVLQHVRKKIPTLSLDTVYRNLRLLAEQGLIDVVGMSQDSARFDGNMQPHHHFTCVKCGLIRDFYLDGPDAIAMPETVLAHGAPLSLHLEVKGVCAACQKRTSRA